MDDERSLDDVPSHRDRERAMQPRARELLRSWIRADGSDAFERIGQAAIRATADAVARLGRFESADTAEQVLAQVETLARTLLPSSAPRSRWGLRERPPTGAPVSLDPFAPLVENLDRQRDDISHRQITSQSDRARFSEADHALEDAVHLIRAVTSALDAAAREVRGHEPDRAARLHDDGAASLLERERAVLTQLVVNRQAMITLELLISNQKALSAALERARTATLSAIQIATAARRAIEEDAALSRHRTALERDSGTIDARRVLEEAVAQARAALAAMARTSTG